MGAPGDPKRWRELRDGLHALGAVIVRTTGSHEIWRFDDGTTFVVVRNHLGDTVPIGILVKLRRLRARRRALAGEEPVLLGLTRSLGPRPSPERRRTGAA
jgi:predicted RNA binding protein YcfA (HicA-like mRNA interferase family)